MTEWIIRSNHCYGIFASNGILFNHESPRRGPTFVTKKIVQGLVRVKNGLQKKLSLGNLYAVRDWGHAKDYAVSMWKILQNKEPDDWVIATNKDQTVKKFVDLVASKLDIKLIWKGKGIKEKEPTLYWNKMDYKVQKYPFSVVTFYLSIVNDEKYWLST